MSGVKLYVLKTCKTHKESLHPEILRFKNPKIRRCTLMTLLLPDLL
jgi:hypothetical protein